MSFAYIGLFFSGFISDNQSYNAIIGILGWILWIISCIIAFSPNIIFKKKGGVPKGKSYVHTTILVNSGIYGIMRHPQYGGGMFIAFSMCLIIQTPLSWFLAIIAILTAYLSMIFEEKRLMEKFGQEYILYKLEVPRVNLFIGLIRRMRKKKLQ